MCCRLSITPLDPVLAETVLRVGMFTPVQGSFERYIEEEKATVRATFGPDTNVLRLTIEPSIGMYEHHLGKRVAAGVYFEIAAKYAEKVGGRIVQHANVIGCTDDGQRERLLAAYPEQPLMWQQVCAGFREVILGQGYGHEQAETDSETRTLGEK